jgi:hypothetical protein
VHGVASEALDIDPVVVEDVAVEAVVVPGLEYAFVFEVAFELVEDP